MIRKDIQYYKFCLYGFLKNLRFFEAFLVLFFLDRGLSFVQIGFLYSIREISVVLTEIPSGFVADVAGRKKTLVASFLLYIVSFLLFFIAPGFFLFSLAMIFFALADAFRTGVHKAMIYNYLAASGMPDKKVVYYGHTRSWSQAGTAVSALVAGVIVFYSGAYDLIFLASIVPYLLNMLNVASYPGFLDGEKYPFSMAELKKHSEEVFTAFLQSIRKLYFFKVLINNNIYTGFYRAMKDYIQPLLKGLALSLPVMAYLDDEKKTAVVIGIAYFVIYLFTALVSRKSGRFAGRFASHTVPMNLSVLIGLILGVITGIFFVSNFYVVAVVGFILILGLENLRKPIGVAMLADVSRNEAMASVLSVSSQTKSILAAIMAPVIGWIADFRDPGTGILAISILLIILLPSYWLKQPKPTQ